MHGETVKLTVIVGYCLCVLGPNIRTQQHRTGFNNTAQSTGPFRHFSIHFGTFRCNSEGKSFPVTDVEWPRGFQEVKVRRLHENGTGWW